MKLDLDHVVSDSFKVQVFNGSWLSDHEIVYVDQNGSIVVFDADTNKSSSILVKTYDKTLHTMATFKLSPDRRSILFVSDRRQEFGATVSARYAIFNISSQTVEFLDDLVRANYPSVAQPHIQYAAWGSSSNSIIFIESNDIYYIPDFSNAAAGKYERLTTRPSGELIISNGIPDSLYRANIFKDPDSAAVWPSVDGKYLAYLAFDDAQVEPVPIEVYDSFQSSDGSEQSGTYPRIHRERYPRAGAQNPRVTLHVADLQADQPADSTVQLSPPSELVRQQQQDSRLTHYITYVSWLAPIAGEENQLLVMWTNRAQNSSWLTTCDRKSGREWSCDIAGAFTSRVPPTSSPSRQTVLSALQSDGTRLLFVVLPRPDSVIGDHSHVAMFRGKERAPKYLTYGQFDVDRLVSYDSRTDSLYFEAGVIRESPERHLYQISSINQPASLQTLCITCQLIDSESCSYNYAHIAPGARYLVHECLGPSIPNTRMRSLSAVSSGSSQSTTTTGFMASRYMLNTNEHLETLIKTKQMPIEKIIVIKTSAAGGPFGSGLASNGQASYDVHIKLYLPNEIEEEKDKKFPLLIESSEIDRRKVWNKFELDWGKYLTSRKQLVYAKIDCIRASGSANSPVGWGSESSAYLASSFGSPGESEPQSLVEPLFNAKDQAEVIRFIAENVEAFPFIDRRRVAIWGPSSSSAYLALATTVLDDLKLIQCTIAVSPITNWRYMSSYVAERYLGLPWIESNSLKYERANLLKRAYEFSARRLLLVHGTADEQVHIQHSMQFIKSLTEHTAPHLAAAAPSAGGSFGLAGVIHQMQLYPDVGHSLEQVKRHYFMTLDGFVDRCFYQKPIAIKATEWKGKVRPKLY